MAKHSPKARVVLKNVLLSNFLSEDDFAAAMEIVRGHIIRVFVKPPIRDKRRKRLRERPTPGLIAHLDGRLGSLANDLMGSIGKWALKRVYSISDLPPQYHCESRHDREFIVELVWCELIMRQLVLLQNGHEVYYCLNAWHMQVVMDESGQSMDRNVQVRMYYRNQRSWHGQQARTTKGSRCGTSIGTIR
jgi:hypothetical protein